MSNFIVKTNFGYTFEWTKEQIAEDYAATAIQWQDDDDTENPMSYEELKQEILNDPNHLQSWYNDQISGDVTYAFEQAKILGINKEEAEDFFRSAVYTLGSEIYD